MSDSAVTGFRLKAAKVQPAGRRFVLLTLCIQAEDSTWRCAVDYDYVASITGQDHSTIQRHMRALEGDQDDGPWIGRERLTNLDGTFAHHRTELSLEKLSINPDQQAKCLLAREREDAVDKAAASSRQFAETTGRFAETSRQNARSLRKKILPSSSFLFKDDLEREIVERVLDVCGPGLADVNASRRPLDSLTQRLEAWLVRWDLELDILPVIEAQTARPRRKPVYDFALFEPDIAAHRRARTPGPALVRHAIVTNDQTRLEQLQHDLRRIEQGRTPVFTQVNGETIEPLKARVAAEIAAVEARLAAKAQAGATA